LTHPYWVAAVPRLQEHLKETYSCVPEESPSPAPERHQYTADPVALPDTAQAVECTEAPPAQAAEGSADPPAQMVEGPADPPAQPLAVEGSADPPAQTARPSAAAGGAAGQSSPESDLSRAELLRAPIIRRLLKVR
jgi:hypothetical protein